MVWRGEITNDASLAFDVNDVIAFEVAKAAGLLPEPAKRMRLGIRSTKLAIFQRIPVGLARRYGPSVHMKAGYG